MRRRSPVRIRAWAPSTANYHAAVRRPLGRLLGVAGFGAIASQAGHLLIYQLQYGAAAASVQSQAAHAYFPTLAKTALGVATAGLVAALLIVGAARLASGRPVRPGTSPALMPLLSLLFTVQVVVFIAQETIEAVVAGVPPHGVISLLLLGSVGQLPVALVAALAIKWLAARVEQAVFSLNLELSRGWTISPTGVISPVRARPAVQTALAEASPASFVKRGPPRHLLS